MSEELEVGKVYKVRHRKGGFTARINAAIIHLEDEADD